MAVEARHLNLFPPQLLSSREITNPIEANTNMYSNQMGYGVPLSGGTTTTTAETLLPMYSSVITDSISRKTPIKSESGLTYNVVPVQRKRSRDSMINPLLSYPTPVAQSNKTCAAFSFLGQDLSFQIQQQQLDIDCLVSQHMEKVRMEIEERRKRQARRIIEAIETGMMKRLRAKEDEIEKIGKLNWALEEKVKSLFVENQIWRDLAQSNEATANTLRSNLEHVLAAQAKEDRTLGAGLDDQTSPLMDDAQSCCGSSGGDGDDGWEEKAPEWCALANGAQGNNGAGPTSRWLCRNCNKEESCVLLLPCRHLCLCTVCGSSLHTCPICKATKNASVHVNFS
ncbi:BOI-RELATED E3 UBIQUITIN-PROTEIN LIGASE 2-RELATED [Salix koriyanagi]|uniref:RING-type E3 ubiquitin transferase n=1 Tax=Salix koriyanagi TaxID=2511006 RepID=A0A9Q0UDA7_9ROSI|nr:BOI-RELATED E3 UBIQUITIN-PROTEIN LIGASE 2-RELATED [Salix koriyanagi]